MSRQFTVSCLVVLALAGCTDSRNATGPETATPSFEIADGAHNWGNAHFYFLPPLVGMPNAAGVFDGTLSPVVTICEWANARCTDPPVAQFTMASGAGSEAVRVVPDDELYTVNWHTDQHDLDPAKTYRIRVLVAGTELGHADVDLVATGRELKNVNSTQSIPLLNGRTLPVNFRIEQGAVTGVRLSGVLRDRDGVSVPNQFVRLLGATEHSTTTGSDGSFSLAVEPGTYELGVRRGGAAGGATIPEGFDLFGPSLTLTTNRVQDLTLRNVFLQVTVRDPSGNPVPNATVDVGASYCISVSFEIFPGGTTGGGLCGSGTTDGSGVARLVLLPSTSASFKVTPPSGSGLTATAVSDLTVIGDTSVDVTLLREP